MKGRATERLKSGKIQLTFLISSSLKIFSCPDLENKVARQSTALGGRRHRCCLPALAGFTRLLMHGAWPMRNVGRTPALSTKIKSRFAQSQNGLNKRD